MHLPALFAYLQGLREHNNKAWFVMNKPAYDILRAEFIVLAGQVATALGQHDPSVADVDPKKALFRIYRDVRFSNDKTPYKSRFSAALARDATARKTGPMYYFHIDADGRLYLGAGSYLPPAELLVKLRRRMLDDTAGLTKIVRRKKFAATFGGLNQEDRLARLPKGYDPQDPAVEQAATYLRLKSLAASVEVDLTGPFGAAVANDLPGFIATTFAAAVPLNDWIRGAFDA